MIEAIRSEGYHTAVIGKNHFGFDYKTDKGVPHGFEYMKLMDGNTHGKDDYSKYFEAKYPGERLMCSDLGWNTWFYSPWCKEEIDHPSSWVGRETVDYISKYSFEKPLFLKSSFHRPHSPYDPPEKYVKRVDGTKLKKVHKGADWDKKYANMSTCKHNHDTWCGEKPE